MSSRVGQPAGRHCLCFLSISCAFSPIPSVMQVPPGEYCTAYGFPFCTVFPNASMPPYANPSYVKQFPGTEVAVMPVRKLVAALGRMLKRTDRCFNFAGPSCLRVLESPIFKKPLFDHEAAVADRPDAFPTPGRRSMIHPTLRSALRGPSAAEAALCNCTNWTPPAGRGAAHLRRIGII
jgi:hypothetical protein